jgi:hypothetical protein
VSVTKVRHNPLKAAIGTHPPCISVHYTASPVIQILLQAGTMTRISSFGYGTSCNPIGRMLHCITTATASLEETVVFTLIQRVPPCGADITVAMRRQQAAGKPIIVAAGKT